MTTPVYRSRPGGFDLLPASMPEARPINDFIYLSEGLSNAFLIVTEEGRVVVNCGMGFESGVHKRNFDAVDDGPVRYILLTQGHVDHVGGADLLRQEGTEIVAQAGNPAHQAEDERIQPYRAMRSAFAFKKTFEKIFSHEAANQGAPLPAQSKPEPTILFDDEYRFELGGLEFELIATPGGETRDSMVIWLPQHQICFSGNLFSALFGHIPNLVTIRGDRLRDPLLFIESLDRVMALEPELLLVGHHDPIEGRGLIREELTRLRGAVMHVHDETVAYMNAGKPVWQAMQEISLPPEFEVGEGYGKVSWCVRAIWEHYVGWFHHESTSELYADSPSSISGDLVELAGGPDALAQRAADKVEAGAATEALRLAEIVLDVEPEHVAALRANIAAHEALEAESVNFWLTSWLRKEIDRMRDLLG